MIQPFVNPGAIPGPEKAKNWLDGDMDLMPTFIVPGSIRYTDEIKQKFGVACILGRGFRASTMLSLSAFLRYSARANVGNAK